MWQNIRIFATLIPKSATLTFEIYGEKMKRIEIKLDDEKYKKFVEYKRKSSANFNAIINAKIDEIF